MLLLLLAVSACAAGDGATAPKLTGSDCAPTAPAAGTYQGSLYDTHAHADLSGAPAALHCLGQRHNVPTIVLFAGATGGTKAGQRVRDWMSPYGSRFTPFVHLDPKSVSDFNVTELDRALATTPQIRGVGELALYRQPWIGKLFGEPPWASVFDWVAANNLWIMVHPRQNQMADFEAIVSAHPNTKVLLHTAWNPVEIPGLLERYPNLYFTLDLASLISVPMSAGIVDVLLAGDGSAADFIRRYDAERDAILQESYQRWYPTIAAAPERVMWGTDVHMDWHFQPAVYDRLMDFTRRWIALLPADLRDDFAYRNAERALGPGVRF
jgi:hypothetical protein